MQVASPEPTTLPHHSGNSGGLTGSIATRYEPFALRRPTGAIATLLIDRRRRLKTQELARRLHRALARSGRHELRLVRVYVDAYQIRLTGKVSRFYHKQLAQEAVRLLAAHRRINNQIHVD